MIVTFEVIDHRAMRGDFAEHTHQGYRKTLQAGAVRVDMDVGITADGVLVVHHGSELDPNTTRDSKGNYITEKILIKNLTLDQLRKYDVGQTNPKSDYAKLFPEQIAADGVNRILTLQEVIEYVKEIGGDKIAFQIEPKTDPDDPDSTHSPKLFAEKIVNILKKNGIEGRTDVQSFDWRTLLEIQKKNPSISTAYLTDTDMEEKMLSEGDSFPEMIAALGGKVWGAQDIQVNKKNVAKAHDLSLKVRTWSWPERTGAGFDVKMIFKLIRIGVDGIITDYPEHLNNLKIILSRCKEDAFDTLEKMLLKCKAGELREVLATLAKCNADQLEKVIDQCKTSTLEEIRVILTKCSPKEKEFETQSRLTGFSKEDYLNSSLFLKRKQYQTKAHDSNSEPVNPKNLGIKSNL